MAARIKENFLYKELESALFFIKNPNLKKQTKKKRSGGWEGRGWGCGQGNCFFFLFFKTI